MNYGKGDTREDLVLLLDNMPFKRAAFATFLSEWANEAGLVLVPSCIDEVFSEKQTTGFKLVICSVGGANLADQDVAELHRIRSVIVPGATIVALGDSADTENVERAIEAGFSAYISTGLETDVAIAALDFVLAGGTYFPPDALRKLGGQPMETPPKGPPQISNQPRIDLATRNTLNAPKPVKGNEPLQSKPNRDIAQVSGLTNPACNDLTTRQQEVLDCIVRAQSNKEIARELDMSEATVKVHVRQVMKKLGAMNRTHAAILATTGDPQKERMTKLKTVPLKLYRPQMRETVVE
ncbi:response regulator transcription factor [Tropicimonas marinistellae]|uniref:response regulator transcription factor n=1 Tax=Tropicimonas marinistellae TaxID=1739787 RepID=UPI00082D7B05|nr:response regulator transcription factor [Tropicimonas marinistellae]